ncbi:MAG TPA: hypothetical protein VIH71_15795 [Solirubrobacteraceae bacterium]
MTEPAPTPKVNRGAYDIRKGAAGYASIMGSVSGFTVPTVILVFTVAHQQAKSHPADFTLIVGLLVLSLLGCLASAFAFSAISGEEYLTPNLPAATMYVGVGVVVSIVSIIASFEILAHIYLKTATGFFAAITAGGGLTGAIFNGLSVVDDWEMRINRPELGSSDWLVSRRHAHAWAARLCGIGCFPVLLGLALYWDHIGIRLTATTAQAFGGAGIFLTTASIICGTLRTLHASSETIDKGVTRAEAIALQSILGISLLTLMLVLPS